MLEDQIKLWFILFGISFQSPIIFYLVETILFKASTQTALNQHSHKPYWEQLQKTWFLLLSRKYSVANIYKSCTNCNRKYTGLWLVTFFCLEGFRLSTSKNWALVFSSFSNVSLAVWDTLQYLACTIHVVISGKLNNFSLNLVFKKPQEMSAPLLFSQNV